MLISTIAVDDDAARCFVADIRDAVEVTCRFRGMQVSISIYTSRLAAAMPPPGRGCFTFHPGSRALPA